MVLSGGFQAIVAGGTTPATAGAAAGVFFLGRPRRGRGDIMMMVSSLKYDKMIV
jgi:hypothetical protein